jgi:Putative peptidoglycan binding domain/Transglycosylase-like domain
VGLLAAVPPRARRRPRRRALARALAATALIAAAGADDAAADTPTAAATASAAQDVVVLKRGDRGPAVSRLQRRLGVAADGAFGRQTLRAVKRFQLRRGLEPDGVVGPLTRRALGLRPFGRGSVFRARSQVRVTVPAILRRIALCDSGGNPAAVSSGGLYRGKYQFTRGTWQSLGGRGDPARAPEWLQVGSRSSSTGCAGLRPGRSAAGAEPGARRAAARGRAGRARRAPSLGARRPLCLPGAVAGSGPGQSEPGALQACLSGPGDDAADRRASPSRRGERRRWGASDARVGG